MMSDLQIYLTCAAFFVLGFMFGLMGFSKQINRFVDFRFKKSIAKSLYDDQWLQKIHDCDQGHFSQECPLCGGD